MILHIQDKTGDTQVAVEENVELATTLFNEAMANGKMAYMTVEGENEVIFDLNEAVNKSAEKVLITPHYVGG